MGATAEMRTFSIALLVIALFVFCNAVDPFDHPRDETGSDSDACWACTDMSDALCKKECYTACDAKGEKKDFERGDYAYRKCFDKCENKCSKKYFYDHCDELCDDGPPMSPEESRRVVKEYEAKMEKEI